LSSIVNARISERSSWFARQSIEHEVSGCALRCVARVQTLFVIDHRRDLGSSSIFIDLLRNCGYQIFAEAEMVLSGWRLNESASGNYVSGQTTVVDSVERRLWWSMPCLCGIEERITGHSCCWHRRHCECRQWDKRRRRCAGENLTVRQSARAWNGNPIRIQQCSRLKHVVRAPQLPHALCKVRIEVAMEDGIANDLVSVAGAAINDFGRKCVAWSKRLTIEIC